MRHSHPDVHLGVDAGRDGVLHLAARVVQQHLVVSNLNADWRQTAQISVERRGQGILRIGCTQIGPDLTLANDLARALGTSPSKMIIEAEKVRIPSEKSP